MVVNRIGDVGVVLAMLIMFDCFKTLDYSIIFPLIPYFSGYQYIFLNFSVNLIDLLSILLFIGVAGKSAQIGLHV